MRVHLVALVALAGLLAQGAASARAATPVDLSAAQAAPRAPGRPFGPTGLPDRILLTPGADPARSMAVSFRTAPGEGAVEIAPFVPSPGFAARARAIPVTSTATTSENGPASYHRALFADLAPATAYAYRVKGPAGWSEWHQFRTADDAVQPFRFIYLGDTQNGILPIASLGWRRALLAAGEPALMVHAGDLVDQRDDLIPDDEWGEWMAAGGWALASLPQLAAAGNHEYLARGGVRALGGHFPLLFASPGNGAPGVEATTGAVTWQGTRFIVLDGTSALDRGTLEAQTRWLEAQLRKPVAPGGWTIVVFHQPLFTCARPQDTVKLKQAWQPLFERHGVDLVLQGHDHCYSRLSDPAGRAAGAAARAAGRPQGPVYLVSVVGSKQYGLNDRAATQPDRVAEDTMLYQLVDVAPEALVLRAFTADGRLYDGFRLLRSAGGTRLLPLDEALPPERLCTAGRNADGLPCSAKDR